MSNSDLHSVCVFCGSSPGKRPEYVEIAKDVGRQMATSTPWRLVYGGGNRGCMGSVASSYIEAGGRVLGVVPEVMTKSVPKGHPTTSAEGKGPTMINDDVQGSDLFETVLTSDMHARKKRMAAESDLGFVALPGGFGTFEEVFEMVTWTQIGLHRKPVILVNAGGFYDAIRTLVERAIEEEFIPQKSANLIAFVDESDAQREGGWGKAVIAKVKSTNEEFVNSGVKGYFDWSSKAADTSAVGTGVVAAKRPAALASTPANEWSVDVQNLTFSFKPEGEPALRKCNLSLTPGSRCLLIGANGAGKSTILRLLAGKRMPTKGAHMRVFGRDVFFDTPAGGITYLGTEWAMNPVVRSDIQVSVFLDSVGGYRHKERRDQLLDILDVDTNWRMHAISDGERRRVQLTMGLMEPWNVLLLDEVTVDLDVQVRADLLAFLSRETETRGATIIYATHIFDGLQDFPTHLVHMRHGQTTTAQPISWPPLKDSDHEIAALPKVWKNAHDPSSSTLPPTLFETALEWLREDRDVRAEKEKNDAKRQRGAKRDATETDSEKFFSKYDYSRTERR